MSCSSTKNIPEDDQLFVGLTKIEYKDYEKNCRALCERGPSIVVFTLGAKGWAKLSLGKRKVLTPVLMALSLIVCTAYLVDGSYNPFLYFRF